MAMYGFKGYRRFPRRGKSSAVDEIVFDDDKSTAERVLEVLGTVCLNSGTPVEKRTSYLTAFTKLLSTHSPPAQTADLGLRIKEILLCLRIPLLSESADLRSSALRTIRYLIKNNQDVVSVISVNLHLLIVRIIDLDSENRAERLQAVKLARKLLIFGPSSFPVTLVKSLISLTQKNGKHTDRLRRAGIALLCDLSALHPHLFISSGCVNCLSLTLFDCENLPRIIESIIGCLIRIYNVPSLRRESGLDLSNIVSPFTELHLLSELSSEDQSRVDCASTALLSMLRSWPGLLHISNPSRPNKPLQSLVDILHIQTHQSRKISYESRKQILDIIFKSLNLQVPDWTEEFDVAMRTADPSTPKEKWKLTDGFLAAEGQDIIACLSKSRPNLLENHMCVLLSCYLRCQLPKALIQVIVTSDTVLSVRATVLLGQVLHLSTLLLPHEIGAVSQCLPELAEHIATSNPTFNKSESNRAISAVTYLQRLHTLKKLGPRPHSLLLEQTLLATGHAQGERFVGDKLSLPAPSPNSAPHTQSAATAIEIATLNNIKESQVIPNRDPQSWRWDTIMLILRWPSDGLKRIEDTNYKIFIRKVTEYFKPSSNMFSRLELENQKTRLYGRIGCALVDFLVSSSSYDPDTGERQRGAETESGFLLEELIQDIFVCIQEVVDSASAHDCMFSPTHLANTACQLYFLFIGRLTSSEQGRYFLEKQQAISLLINLLSSRMDVYLKLIVSSIDYRTADWRLMLTRALSGSSEAGRIYTVRWLGVLARMGAPSFAQYGVELLVEQLKDPALQVAVSSLSVLEEVCDDKMYLEALVAAKSSLLGEEGQRALRRLGGRGRILLTRFLGSSSGLGMMSNNKWLAGELVYWADSFNKQYVIFIESCINDGFTQHQRSVSGHGGYGRRSGEAHSTNDVFVPPHLYGQLALTKSGFEILLGEKAYWEMIYELRDLETRSFEDTIHKTEPWQSLEETWLSIKAAIWGLSSVASSNIGAEELEKEGVISLLINLAESCPLLSIKGTAFYALGLVATTRTGSSYLGHRGWATVRHARTDTWPITYEWLGASDYLFPYSAETIRMNQESPAPSEGWLEETVASGFDFMGYRKRDEPERVRSRRTKTMSECTDTSLSQNMVEIGPPPVEPNFPLPGKLTEKISNWFSTSKSEGRHEPKNGTSRRYSEGGKPGSSFTSKLRNSFNRKRSKTISAGSLPSREGTPVSSVDKYADNSENDSMVFRRRLSFGQEDAPANIVPASSPETMPGEIFQLDNIVEEPTNPQMPPVNKPKVQAKREEGFNQSIGSSTGQQLETSLTSNTSIPLSDSSVKEPHRLSEIQITFSAQKYESGVGHVSMRQGTSASSVSSVGSFTFQGNYGHGSLARKRIEKRPQLSECEDADQLISPRPPPLGRQESYASKTKSLTRSSGTRQSICEPPLRSISVPPRPVSGVPRFDNAREAAYWGIAYPLNHDVLYPQPVSASSSPGLDLPGIVGAWLNISPRHVAGNCLSCCRLRPSARPRAASLSVAKDDPRCSLLLSSSFPSSQQSPELKRKSWNPVTSVSAAGTGLLDPESPEAPLNYEDAKAEALHLICQLNSVFRYKQSEAGLNKLKGRAPEVFRDLCFYSDICQVLGEYDFRRNARKFVQVLFSSVEVAQMVAEARHILNPDIAVDG